jgi:transposase
MPIPLYKRYEIVFLSLQQLGPKLSNNDIAKRIGCTTKMVKYWLQRYNTNKDLNELYRSGRNRCSSENEDKQIIQISEREKGSNTTLIQKKMINKGVRISKETIRRRLRENGARWANPNVKKFLENKHRENRLNWAYQVRGID